MSIFSEITGCRIALSIETNRSVCKTLDHTFSFPAWFKRDKQIGTKSTGWIQGFLTIWGRWVDGFTCHPTKSLKVSIAIVPRHVSSPQFWNLHYSLCSRIILFFFNTSERIHSEICRKKDMAGLKKSRNVEHSVLHIQISVNAGILISWTWPKLSIF